MRQAGGGEGGGVTVVGMMPPGRLGGREHSTHIVHVGNVCKVLQISTTPITNGCCRYKYLPETESSPTILCRWDRQTNCDKQQKKKKKTMRRAECRVSSMKSVPIDWHSVLWIKQVGSRRIVDDDDVFQRATNLWRATTNTSVTNMSSTHTYTLSQQFTLPRSLT